MQRKHDARDGIERFAGTAAVAYALDLCGAGQAEDALAELQAERHFRQVP